MKTITFKPEFEKKLIELRIKTKFVKNIIAYKCNKNDSIEKFIFFLNKYETWNLFIKAAFQWANTPKDEGFDYWWKISLK